MSQHISDFTKAPKNIVVDLINHDNPGANLTPEMVTFGLPTVSSSGEAEGRNTELTVSGVQETGVIGSTTVYYNRLNLAAFIVDPEFVVQLTDSTKVSHIIAKLNAELGINITADDFVEADLPTFVGTPGEERPVTITFSADSLVWAGNATITVRGEDVNISTLITNVRLSGLNAPL
jgi:hypothetical protein